MVISGRHERTDEAAGSGQCEHPAGDAPRVGDARGREADGEGSDHPQQHDRGREQRQRGGKGADDGTGGHRLDPLDREFEQRGGAMKGIMATWPPPPARSARTSTTGSGFIRRPPSQ